MGKWAYLAGGYVLFAIGGIGIFVPGLPTTIFWIGAAACFAKSSPTMYRKILTWPKIGPAIHDFLAHGIIGRNAKRAALIAMSICALIVTVLAFGTWTMGLSLLGIGIGAAIVISRPTSRAPSGSPYRGPGDEHGCPFLAHAQMTFPDSDRFTA